MNLKWIFLVGTILFYLLFIIISDIEKISNNLFEIKIEFLLIILLIQFIGFFVRGIRQTYLLKQIQLKISLQESLKIFFASLALIATPGGSGILIKSEFLKRKFGFSRSKTAPVVITERFEDLFSGIILLGLTTVFFLNLISFATMIFGGTVLLIIWICLKQKKYFIKIREMVLKLKIIKNFIPNETFHESFETLMKPSIIFKSTCLSLAIWMIELSGVYFSFLMFGIDWEFFIISQNYLISIIYGGISMVPGGVGVAEASLVSQISQEIDLALSTSLVLFIRITTIWFATIIGLIFLKFVVQTKNNN